MKNIDICLKSDKNFTKYLGTTIVSILKNSNADEKITFHIIDGGILQDDKDKLVLLKEIKDCNIKFYTVDNELVKKYEEIHNKKKTKEYHVTSAAYYTLELHNILKDLDKILYMDCDLIVNKSLYELFNQDVNGYSMVVADRPSREGYAISNFKRLGMNNIDTKKYTYFNTGVLLINLKYWRENSVNNLFVDFFNNQESIEVAEQDLLNYVFYNKVKYVDYHYNFLCEEMAKAYKETEKAEDIYVFHYTNGTKPWIDYSYKIKFLDEYWKYFLLTPWFKENPYEYINTIIYQKIKINENKFNISSTQNTKTIIKTNNIDRYSIADFIFSITYKENYKIITIFGIKITLKKR